MEFSIGNSNILDWVILAVFSVLVVIGFLRGLIGSVIIIATLYLAFLLSRLFADELLEWVSTNFGWFENSETLGNFISAAVIFLLVIMVGAIVYNILSELISKIPLGVWIDKFGGAILGLAAGLIVLFFGITYTYASVDQTDESDDYVQRAIGTVADEQLQSQFKKSQFLPFIVDGVGLIPEYIVDYAPESSRDSFDSVKTITEKTEDP